MVERIKLQSEVAGYNSDIFLISHIQISPTRDKRSSICQLCQSSIVHGTETKPLLIAVVELKFQRTEMQMDVWHFPG